MSVYQRFAFAFLPVCLLVAGCGGGGGGSSFTPDVVLLTSSLPDGVTGEHYDVFLEAVFAHPPGRFIKVSGALPPGIQLDGVTGELSGHARQVGTFRFEIEARDGQDPDAPRDFVFPTDRKRFDIVVTRGEPNFIPPFTLEPAQYRGSYTHVFDVAGGTPPYEFEFAGGELPAGLTVNDDGVLGNFPTAARQDPYVFQVRVTDALGVVDVETFTIVVVILPLIIGTPGIPEAAREFPYSVTFDLASPGGGSPYTWSQVAPGPGETDLASIGMEITPGGVLRNKSGTPGPSTAGDFTFSVTVTDQALQVSPVRTYTLKVNPGPVLEKITPNKAAAGGPFIVAGLNFQNGATLTFNPGQPSEQTITPIFDSATQLRFNAAPGLSVSGFIPVKVTNPDTGAHTKQAAFAYPATTFDFEGTARVPIPNSPLSSTGIDVADVNGDGFADIVHCGTSSAEWANATGTAGGLDVLVNTPPPTGFDPANPTFTRITVASGDFHEVSFADLNSDGRPDIVSVGNFGGVRQVRAYLNGFGPSTPAFTSGQAAISTVLEYQGEFPSHVSDIALGQMTTGDTIPDMAYLYQDSPQIVPTVVFPFGSTAYYTYEEAGGTVSTLRGLGGGAFATANLKTESAISKLFSAAGVSLGKFDGDTRVDIHVADESNNHTSQAWWLTGQAGSQGVYALTDSSGLFGEWTPLVHNGTDTDLTESLGTASGDINGDGDDDVVVASGTNYVDAADSSWGSPSLTSFAGNGSGTFGELPIYKPAIRYRYDAIFDADFDLALDVVVTGGSPGGFNKVDLFKGRPATAGLLFKEQLTASVGSPNIGRVAAGDVNGDGKPDVVACLSMFADSRLRSYWGSSSYDDRGNGSTMGVVFFLNNSN